MSQCNWQPELTNTEGFFCDPLSSLYGRGEVLVNVASNEWKVTERL